MRVKRIEKKHRGTQPTCPVLEHDWEIEEVGVNGSMVDAPQTITLRCKKCNRSLKGQVS